MKLNKKIKITIGCLMLCLIPFQTYAHTSGTTGSESSQWILDINNHAGTTSIGYKIDVSVNSTYASYIKDGAARWNSVGPVSFFNTNTTNKGVFSAYADPDTSTVAFFGNYSSTNGHLSSWNIFLNIPKLDAKTVEGRKVTMAHELGHSIGLNDLYSSNNIGVLMYGYSDRNATYPTAADKAGATEGVKN
jgi:hypothetical protein